MEDDPAVEITIVNNNPLFHLKKSTIVAMVRSLCASLHLDEVELCLSFVTKDEIQELNRTFRHKDYPTDVLSFPQVAWQEPLSASKRIRPHAISEDGIPAPLGEQIILGDLVISLEVAEENAAAIGQALDRELCFLIIHGLLHLCGHDHQQPEEEAVMLAEQQYLLATLSLPSNSKPQWEGCVYRKRQVKNDDR